jgi:hypothetical protein
MTTPSVMIGMPVGSGSLPWATALSLMKTLSACRDEGLPVQLEAVVGCSVVTWARSAIADAFLKSNHSHLMWIDADLVWTPSDFFRLVGLGAALDVVGATYPFKKQPIAFLINHVGKPDEYEVNGLGCIKIRGMGIGFTIIKRAVVEKVAATKPKRRDPITGLEYADIFRIDHEGEDLAFFTDVRAAGFDCWLDPSISLGHIGPAIFKGNVIEALGLQDYAVFQKPAPREIKA